MAPEDQVVSQYQRARSTVDTLCDGGDRHGPPRHRSPRLAAILTAAVLGVAGFGFGIVLTVIRIFLPEGLHQAFRGFGRRLSLLRPDSRTSDADAVASGSAAPDVDSPLLERPGRPAAGTPLLQVTGLTKRFGGVVESTVSTSPCTPARSSR